jgi:hypothetical protein
MKLASIVLTQNTEHLTDRQRWQACKSTARDYPSLGYLHTHQTAAQGGKFTPHIHLFLMLPEDRVALWAAGAKADLVRRFAPTVIELSDSATWVIDPDKPVNLLRYAIGQGRQHTPVPAYWTSSNRYRDEQRALDALLSQALFRLGTGRGSFFVTPKGKPSYA